MFTPHQPKCYLSYEVYKLNTSSPYLFYIPNSILSCLYHAEAAAADDDIDDDDDSNALVISYFNIK